jgi:hypothetical protein
MRRTWLTAALVAIALALAAPGADAISRYNPTAMSCASAKAKVSAEGAVIFRWASSRNPGLPLYNRFVRNKSYCLPGERAVISYVPTADTKSCALKTCKRCNPERFNFKGKNKFFFPLRPC